MSFLQYLCCLFLSDIYFIILVFFRVLAVTPDLKPMSGAISVYALVSF